MKIKVSTASGPVLDWMVAKLVGKSYVKGDTDYAPDGRIYQRGTAQPTGPHYSTDWAQGGPIIEREKISIRQWTNVPIVHAYMPVDDAEWASDGASPLIAAMRCFVASKLGEEVEVPDELA